jgi:hypothetical protein
MIQVKVLKLAGETGLRTPGSTYYLHPDKVKLFVKMGLVSKVLTPLNKEEKAVVETKELKFERHTKKRK